nr:uncharacterized protein LOC118044195 [Populus alba]
MLTSSSNHPQKSLKLKQDDKKVFSRRLARDVSLSNMSTEDYHVGASVAVPFTWESQPGTPKIKFREHPLPPLTPPPSYSYNNPKRPTKKLSNYQYLHGQQHVLCLLRQRRSGSLEEVVMENHQAQDNILIQEKQCWIILTIGIVGMNVNLLFLLCALVLVVDQVPVLEVAMHP